MESSKLNIAGQIHDRESLLRFCAEPSDQEWLQDIKNFISQWLDDSQYVEVHTSGSTGTPKRICLLKSSMRQSAILTGDALGLAHGDTALLCIPANYIGGKMMIVRSFVLGLELHWVSPSELTNKQGLPAKVNFTAMIPYQVQKILNDEALTLEQFGTLIIGGAPVSSDLKSELLKVNSPVYATYGMTETASHIALQRLNGKGDTTHFKALKDVTLRTDENKKLSIRAPHISTDWIETNDLVELGEEGKFIWLGRADNVINSGGVKIIPEQVESKLSGHIESAFFIDSSEHPTLGRQVVLFIEAEEQSTSAIPDDVLSKYERPKQILYLNPFVRSANGKILRAESKKAYHKKTV